MKDMLTVTSSPHLRHPDSTASIMGDVLLALSPAAIFGCILFGLNAVLLIVTCVISAVLAEFIWNKLLKKPNSIGDLSAVVTGLLLAMNLSSAVPLWMAAIGSVVAIIVVKQMFGGLGYNFVNPALASRIVLLVSFPAAMTVFYEPVRYEAITSATPLGAETLEISFKELFFGMHGGCIGETSAFLLLIGGIYLIIRRVIKPIIPLCFIGTVALLTLISSGDLTTVTTQVFGGGLMLGAIFMATDYTTSPTTNYGKLIFGVGCGFLTFIIREFAALTEGVSYAILIMNILVPYINKATMHKPFGVKK